MTRLRARIMIWKHRMLFWCSRAYRDLDAIMCDREKWRRAAATAESSLEVRFREVGDLKDRLKLALEAQESATGQLLTERALRQSAEQRADNYHREFVESLKSATDWATKIVNRRPMFGGPSETAEADAALEVKPSAIRPKPMARQVANAVTDATLRKLMEDIRAGKVPEEQQVGPEFGPV